MNDKKAERGIGLRVSSCVGFDLPEFVDPGRVNFKIPCCGFRVVGSELSMPNVDHFILLGFKLKPKVIISN